MGVRSCAGGNLKTLDLLSILFFSLYFSLSLCTKLGGSSVSLRSLFPASSKGRALWLQVKLEASKKLGGPNRCCNLSLARIMHPLQNKSALFFCCMHSTVGIEARTTDNLPLD